MPREIIRDDEGDVGKDAHCDDACGRRRVNHVFTIASVGGKQPAHMQELEWVRCAQRSIYGSLKARQWEKTKKAKTFSQQHFIN